jgi:DNA-binding PadR family transcriptional regulator
LFVTYYITIYREHVNYVAGRTIMTYSQRPTWGTSDSGRGPFRGRHHGRRHHPDFGPAFGPEAGGGPEHRGDPDHGAGGRHSGHGPHGDGHRGGPFRGGRDRAQRGDVRTATLFLLAEGPMHGYQLMQTMAERTQGAWRPSPGAIYPTINQLEDEGLVVTTAEGGRKLVTLTEAGRGFVAQAAAGDPFAGFTASGSHGDLRGVLDGLHAATRQVARTGTSEQRAAAERVLVEARRSLYLILAGEPASSASQAVDDADDVDGS